LYAVVYLKPKQLIIKDCARRFVLKLYRHEASHGLFATAELLVVCVLVVPRTDTLNFLRNELSATALQLISASEWTLFIRLRHLSPRSTSLIRCSASSSQHKSEDCIEKRRNY